MQAKISLSIRVFYVGEIIHMRREADINEKNYKQADSKL